MNPIDALLAWCRAATAAAGERGFELRSGATDDDRPKSSAWVTVSKGEREAELIVWSSGEAELGRLGDDGEVVQEHHEIADEEHLGRLLDSLVDTVDPGRE